MSSRRTLAPLRGIEKVGAWLFPHRGTIWGVLGGVVYLFAHPTVPLFRLGLLLVILGECLRLWACGYIKTYRGPMEEVRELTTAGPYAYLRNPLYLANGCIGLGIVFLSGLLVLVPLFLGVFIFLYGSIIRAEEAFLAKRFGAVYEEYASAVPRFVPRLVPYPKRKGTFSLQVLLKRETATLGTLVFVVLLFYLRGFGVLRILDRIFLGL
ncbi:MAG: isoprenylcysteine carboxylmethyltransferase family protein [Candidatus Caldatribacterium sp.]|uniref:methyltransferase family protein n=1 Tax=Candidatus Caldatribacterium sp. TaxID=2282143 RepID=UPI00299C745D|nr:isoprenylcysteine carboxylmethyltransferase family protein [Candidatus Caldatribacterium sp.]MCX7731504.1 isoprenylcysteine carboxylmethyltransferase family protein [Candidatus Caldatribacterium sp.]MDW8081852.1 isoprenylcysteine carboxylmethyltransferase family protein [Candidatus Calescibacterium sp.]